MKTGQRLQIVGLMSGSSLDGLDIAACHFQIEKESNAAAAKLLKWELQVAETVPFSNEWKIRLRDLPHQSALELALAHAHFGRYLGELTAEFIGKHQLTPDAIASHGHTIFHFPEHSMTYQLGDGAAISAVTQCTVINDFRSSDIALGGQGAPLAPVADQYLYGEYDGCLNLGGIANLSWKLGQKYVAFDVTGVNQVLNALAQQKGKSYDAGGVWAAAGSVNAELLKKLNQAEFFILPYPKSLGNHWVQNELVKPSLIFEASIENKLHTVCVHVAQQIASHIHTIIHKEHLQKDQYRIMASGGGAHNDFLMACIQKAALEVGPISIEKPDNQVIDFKEAILMALLGALRLTGASNCLASATGARHNAVGGAIYTSTSRA